MRLSIENGAVVLSQENKNTPFVNGCYGMFECCADGKQKMYWLDPEQAHCADNAIVYNAETLNLILINAKFSRLFGTIEVDEEVLQLNAKLQAEATLIKERRRADKLQTEREEENRRKWSYLCKHGCGKCANLAYDIDIPICRQTGQELEEKNVPGLIKGTHYCFNWAPFPSESCHFNINKNKEKTKV
ncbi:MAG: histone H2A type 1-B/E-like protein [Caudoviricetes sp.]|nr:MAG: histone H2A type 1-B/E-like protein [Caudoviricetes sp.]